MNVDKIAAASALDAGADLWILPSAQNSWWQQLDYRSGFLLSRCLLHQKMESPTKIEEILRETQILKKNFFSPKKSVLIGTSDHFFNNWLLILPPDSALAADEIIETCQSLKVASIRLFSLPEDLSAKLITRLSASLQQISFVQ